MVNTESIDMLEVRQCIEEAMLITIKEIIECSQFQKITGSKIKGPVEIIN